MSQRPTDGFRPAQAEDRTTLDDMTLAGVRFWGHHENHPEAYAGLEGALLSESGPENHPVWVLEDGRDIVGFFELRDRGDHIELLRMFLRLDLIGHGLGRVLWDEAVTVASRSHDRMLIMSDPGAAGFYGAMGATHEADIEVAPGFSIGKFWYELSQPSP